MVVVVVVEIRKKPTPHQLAHRTIYINANPIRTLGLSRNKVKQRRRRRRRRNFFRAPYSIQ